MILISTSSLLGYGVHRIFSIARQTWFDWLDLSLKDTNCDLWDEDYILSLIDQFKVPVLSITAPDKWMNKKKFDIILKIANKVNAQVVTFYPPYYTDIDKEWYYSGLKKVTNRLNISLCVKNIETKFIMFFIPKYKNASLYEIKKVTWNTTLDLSAIDNTTGLDIQKSYNIFGDSVKNILLSDKDWLKTWLIPWKWSWWISYLPLESFLIKLKTFSYNWFITLDVSPKELWVWQEELVLQNLEHFRNYYKKYYLN